MTLQEINEMLQQLLEIKRQMERGAPSRLMGGGATTPNIGTQAFRPPMMLPPMMQQFASVGPGPMGPGAGPVPGGGLFAGGRPEGVRGGHFLGAPPGWKNQAPWVDRGVDPNRPGAGEAPFQVPNMNPAPALPKPPEPAQPFMRRSNPQGANPASWAREPVMPDIQAAKVAAAERGDARMQAFANRGLAPPPGMNAGNPYSVNAPAGSYPPGSPGTGQAPQPVGAPQGPLNAPPQQVGPMQGMLPGAAGQVASMSGGLPMAAGAGLSSLLGAMLSGGAGPGAMLGMMDPMMGMGMDPMMGGGMGMDMGMGGGMGMDMGMGMGMDPGFMMEDMGGGEW